MSKTIKIIACVICVVMLLSSLTMTTFADLTKGVTGSQNTVSSEITLTDGTKTGATWTEMKLLASTKFNTTSSNKEINIVEFNLKNTHLSVDVFNCGNYLISKQTVENAVASFASANPDKTVLAAMNGDLFFTTIHSNENVTKQLFAVPRGITMIDGEIWNTQQFGMENAEATNAEKGNTTPSKAAFGVTATNQPLVGIPEISVNIKNDTMNTTIGAEGINRLPAMDSIVVYNYRCNTTNYALDDSYEIEIEADNTAFNFKGAVSGTVKAIYPAGSQTRPSFGANTIVITARGNKISNVQNAFKVGDKVSFTCDVVDLMGNNELWKNVEDAIGGHIMVLNGGRTVTGLSGNTEYPVALIGFKDDGTVMFTTVTAEADKSYKGVNYNTATDLLIELGYNSVFFLDGGGSTTLMSLEKGKMVRRTSTSDGENSPRVVVNGVAVCYNKTPVCEKQGSLSYIKVPVDLSKIPGYHIPADLMPEIITGHSNCAGRYDAEENAYILKSAESGTNDPYASLDMKTLGRISADEYKYIVIKAKTTRTSSSNLKLYYYAGSNLGASESCTAQKSIRGSNAGWAYYIFDMSSNSNWKGLIHGARLDIFDGIVTNGAEFYFGGITFCKDKAEAEKVATGEYLPEGAITSYAEFVGAKYPVETDNETVTEEESTTVEDTTVEESTPEESTAVEDNDSAQGCKSTVGFGIMAIVSLAVVAAVVAKKKKITEHNN